MAVGGATTQPYSQNEMKMLTEGRGKSDNCSLSTQCTAMLSWERKLESMNILSLIKDTIFPLKQKLFVWTFATIFSQNSKKKLCLLDEPQNSKAKI